MTLIVLSELSPAGSTASVSGMGESLLQQQLDEVRALLARARELFGVDPLPPPPTIAGESTE